MVTSAQQVVVSRGPEAMCCNTLRPHQAEQYAACRLGPSSGIWLQEPTFQTSLPSSSA